MKKIHIVAVFTVALLVALLAGASSTSLRGAGSNAAEEAAIRKQIAANDTFQPGLRLPDGVAWIGSDKRPVVGSETGEPIGGEQAVANRVANSSKITTEVIRIVVADSHDLAYEYSKSILEYDLKSGPHVAVQTGVLRVWQKQSSNWKIAAFFAQPYDRAPAP